MAYTAYKFKPSFVEKRLKSYKSNLMKFKGHDNLRERCRSEETRCSDRSASWVQAHCV